MKKTTILILIFLAIALIAAGFYFYLTRPPVNPPANGQNFPPMNLPDLTPVATSTLPVTDKIVVGASSGGVRVNNFYKNAVEIYPWRDVDLKRQDGYQITYVASEERFYITINDAPVDKNIAAAEAAFLSSLGISRAEACRLSVWLAVMGNVDANLSGRNLGLSFCP